MPQSGKLEEVLGLARESERKYNWVNATDLYKQALRAVGERDFSKNGEIQERIGYCFYRAAFQAETHGEFKRRMKLSSEAYEGAAELFDRLKDSKKRTRMICCRARALYNRSWLVEESFERKELLDECWRLEKKALTASKKAGDCLDQGKLRNELLYCLYDRSRIEWDGKQLAKIVHEAVSYGETAIEILSKVRNARELAMAYCMTSLHCFYGANISEPGEKRNAFSQKCVSYANKGLELSQKVGDSYLVGLSNWAAAIGALHFSGNMVSSIEHVEKMLQQGVTIQDNYVVGVAGYQLASITGWMMRVEEDLEKQREGYTRAIRYSEDAVRHLRIVNCDYFIALTPLAKNYFFLAEVETNRKTKRILLEKAIEAGRKSLEHAERSDSPEAIGAIKHELSKALHSLSIIKVRIKEKKNMLEEASKHRQGYINIVERMYPSNYWVLGVGQTYQALIGAELAKIEPKKEGKKKLLEVAAFDMDNSLKSIEKWAKSYPQTRIFAVLGKYYDQFGRILNQLYWLTRDKAILENAIKVYARAADTYRKAGQLSRLAEAHWNIAKLYDHFGENMKASENFESAADAYRASAEKIQRLNDFYFDYASYMQAWSEIEKARYRHSRQEHDLARKHYEKASSLHKSSKSWKYLASNYLAWVQLEHGEDLSRGEMNQEAIKAFRKAAELFREAKRTLQDELEKITDADEKNLASKLTKASDTREGYCLGRVVVEEAKILDRLSDCMASSKKYKSAAEMFQKIAEAESGHSRKELLPITYLCQAWEKMMMAEAKASSALYGKAAELFKVAKEHTIDKRTSLLALANSSFCKALEAGTEFEITRNMAKYSIAKRHLEVASSYYLKAGFESASEYTRATHRLFDAYVYMSKAVTETDLRTKAQYYQMSRKLLQVSVSSYMKAKYPEKGEEVQRLLESVKEEQQLIMSLTAVLHAPTAASTTSSFTMPTPTHEKAVGLDKFEHAAIEANLVLSSTKATAGENFDLEMQIANVGKETALLTKVEEILPPGFELVAKPDYCNFEDACLEMKGKKLNPLKTEEVRLILRSFGEGRFAIKPRIVYVDETGSKMSCEPEPAAIEVSEVTLPSRVATGYKNLDCLLFGGIPKNYAVIVTSASCDEKELLIKRFLEAGAKKGQVTFYVTIKASGVDALTEEFESSLYLFICNPQADKVIKSLPNVFELTGVENLTNISIAMTSAFRKLSALPRENLTNISIAMTSAFRKLSALPREPRRACIEIISDVLLQHHAVSTRRWLTGFIADLRSKGFTTLAVMNPQMHSPEEVHAILGLFEGQINIYEKETERGLERFLRVTKMYNQRYLQSELPLKKESI
jgi:KaiC/GvpD/RAD55 family RecA-like ATPase/exonuclease VII small subunit